AAATSRPSATSPSGTSTGWGFANRMTSDGDGSRVVAVVRDLFFVARIRETARLAGVPLEFARTPENPARALTSGPHCVLLDLTGGFDYAQVFETVAAAGSPPVLGFTTHAAARPTPPGQRHGRRQGTQ